MIAATLKIVITIERVRLREEIDLDNERAAVQEAEEAVVARAQGTIAHQRTETDKTAKVGDQTTKM